MMQTYYDQITETSLQIKHQFSEPIDTAIILGSGLSQLVDKIENPCVIAYEDIVNFPEITVKGHQGKLVIGKYQNKNVLMMAGRFHYYEGYSMKEVVFPIYVFKALGIKNLVVTNACGAINTDYQPGDIVLIDDFISLVSNNPLIGVNDERLGSRFVDMSEPYKKDYMDLAQDVARELSIPIERGVYGFFQGPYYETRAEIRAFGRMGCDLIGMSTVPETIAANHAGLNVLAFACVTNMATGIKKDKHSHDDVVKVANQTGIKLMNIMDHLISKL